MKPYQIFLRIIIVIVIAEVATMTLLAYLGISKGGIYPLIDTGLLLIISAPFIHLWVVNGAMRASSLKGGLATAALEQEEAMREKAESSARRLQDLMHNLDAIVYEADAATGRFSFVSERAQSLLGYPAKRWLSEPGFWEGLIHPEDRVRTVERRMTAIAKGWDHKLEYRAVTADGRIVQVCDAVRVDLDENRRPRRIHGIMVETSS
ncbi:MAG TPA: PAS domain-containing protein [Candidatus Deferrimicrobiaceae bacterium]|jgi:PAS domain S-box-containing protein